MATIIEFFESLSYSFVQRSLFTAVFLGIICAVVGAFVILRDMVFLVDGIAHSAFAGGALSILLGINSWITIGGFGILTALSMAFINEKGKLKNETAIGIVFAFTMALAIIFRGMFTQYTNGIDALLFGSLSTVSIEEFVILIVMGLFVVSILIFIKKEMYFITFDDELARANGLPVKMLSYLFLIIVAIVIMVSIRSVGVILILAFLVTPSATAYQLTYNFNKMIVYGIIIAIIGSFLGFMIAYLLDIPANATIVGVLTLLFVFSFILSPKRKYRHTGMDDKYCQTCARLQSLGVECNFCELDDKGKNHNHNHNNVHSNESNQKDCKKIGINEEDIKK